MLTGNRPLGIRKFDSIVFASAAEMIVGVLLSLSDSAITGHILGNDGLSAMNVISPLTGITIFTEALFAVGTSMLYAKAIGDYDQEKADRIFGMGLFFSILTGVLTFAALFVVIRPYLDYMKIYGRVREYVLAYMAFLNFELMLSPVNALLCQMVYSDGDEWIGMASNVAQPVLNIVLSIPLGLRFGIRGIGMGTLISTVAAGLILLMHFMRRSCTVRPKFYVSWPQLRRIMLFGWNDSAMFFFLPALFFIITKFVIVRFGEFYLPVLTVLYALLELTTVYESTGEGMRTILPIYQGDENETGVIRLMDHSLQINLLLGVLSSAVLLIAAPWIPLAFGLEEPQLLDVCTLGLRIFAIACPIQSLLSVFNSYYLNTDKPYLAMWESLLNHLICPLLIVIPVAYKAGPLGIFAGFVCAPYLAAALFFGTCLKIYGKKAIFYARDRRKEPGYAVMMKSLMLTEGEIGAFVADADAFLREQQVETKTALRTELLFEDIMVLIMQKNAGKKTEAECCIRITPEAVSGSIWDTGEIFDLMDSNLAVTSLNSYVVSSLLRRQKVKKHIVATSFNRNVFRISKAEGDEG